MKGYIADIKDQTEANNDFRHVLHTGQNLQLVVMSLKPCQDIGAQSSSEHFDGKVTGYCRPRPRGDCLK